MTDLKQKNGFSFEAAGKKMPYRVPDGFFEQLGDSIISRCEAEAAAAGTSTRPAPGRLTWRAAWTIAASTAAAVIVAVTLALPRSETTTPMSVEQAFENLSAADQDYILDTFSNDMIIDY